MSGPCIFIATNRLKEGRFAAERERVPGLVELIEESETRLLAFNEYANEEGTQVGVVQVRRFRQRHAYTIWAGYVREHEGRRPVSTPSVFGGSGGTFSGCRLAVKRGALGPVGRPSGDGGAGHPLGGS
jgi:hypothetical protein